MPVSGSNQGGQYTSNTRGRKKKSGIPSLQKYLAGDDQFQQDRESLLNNFLAFRAKFDNNMGDLGENYGLTRQRLGQDKQENLGRLQEDFGARGLFGSGIFANEQNDFNMDYQNKFNDARTSYLRNKNQLRSDFSDARRSKNQDLTNLRLDAIRRRAQKFGIQ